MKRLCFSLLGLTLISACAAQTRPAAEIIGLEAFQAQCPDQPPVLSDEQAQELARATAIALAMPRETEQERATQTRFLNEHVLKPLADRDQANRACSLYERARADGALSLGARFNQAVREHRR